MNREIKFRGVSLESADWAYGCLVVDSMTGKQASIITWADMGEENKNSGAYVWEDIDPHTIGQYVGLKDKNGKEIYEGDVLLCNGKVKREVVWIENSMEWYAHNGNKDQIQFPLSHYKIHGTNNIEVIGNIYESPELLTPTPPPNN